MAGVRRSDAGQELVWERAPAPVVVPDAFHLQRQLRYVALNPCRAGLVGDPLEWLWSTHRDVVGAVVDPWVRAETIARRVRQSADDFAQWQHAYVSGDPTVRVDGTPFPRAAKPSRIPEHPLRTIAVAACAATRASADDVRRRTPARWLFMDLARACGWRDADAVALACGARPNAVRWRAQRGDLPPRAAWLCLGDPRLQRLEACGDRHAARIVKSQRFKPRGRASGPESVPDYD